MSTQSKVLEKMKRPATGVLVLMDLGLRVTKSDKRGQKSED